MARRTARVTTVVIFALVFIISAKKGFAQPTEGGTVSSQVDRIRVFDPEVRAAFDLGLRGSATFQAIVDSLRQSDLILFVSSDSCPSREEVGCVRLVQLQGKLRYVRIHLVLLSQAEPTALKRSRARLAAQIGHELQHALEIAHDPSIVDNRSLERAYSRRAMRVDRQRYETDAAIRIGAAVLSELALRENVRN